MPALRLALPACALLLALMSMTQARLSAQPAPATQPSARLAPASAPRAPVASVPPLISGRVAVGSALTLSKGTWRGRVTSLGFRWDSSPDRTRWSALRGQSGVRLTLAVSHAGSWVRGCVRARSGTAWSRWSCSSRAVMVTPFAVADPLVSGKAQEGQILTGTPGRWSGAKGAPERQWQVADRAAGPFRPIARATGGRYEVRAEDIGRYLRMLVTAKNPGGQTRAASKPTAAIVAAPDTRPPSAPIVTGGSLDWQVILALTLRAAGSADPGGGPVSYEWRSSSDGGSSWSPVQEGAQAIIGNEGDNWVQFRARDSSGNASAWAPGHLPGAPAAAAVARIDRTAPSGAPEISGGAFAWRDAPITLVASGGRDNVRVAGYEYRTSDDDGASWSSISSGSQVTIEAEGQTLVQFRARDAAGGTSLWAPSHLSAPALPDAVGVARVNRLAPSLTLLQAPDQADPATSQTVRFLLQASEKVDASSITASDFSVTGGSAPAVSCSERSCILTVVANGSGAVTIAPSAFFGVFDLAGSESRVVGGEDRTVTFDQAPPSLILEVDPNQVSPTRVSPVLFRLASNEALQISTVSASDFSVAGGSLADITCTSINCTISVVPTATAVVSIAPSAGFGVRDAAGNLQTTAGGSSRSVSYDITPPVVNLAQAGGQADPARVGPVVFALLADEPLDVASVTADDIAVSGGVVDEVSCLSATQCQVLVTPGADGLVAVAPDPAFSVTDSLGNAQVAPGGSDRSVTYDTVVPVLSLARAPDQADPTSSPAVRFRLTADEPLAADSVAAGDFAATGGTVTSLACAGATCTVEVTATGSGSVALGPGAAFLVTDTAGNAQTALAGAAVMVDVTPPVLTLEQAADQADPSAAAQIRFTLTADEDLDTATVASSDFSAANGSIHSVACTTARACTIAVEALIDDQVVSIAPSGALAVADALGNVTTTIASGADREVTFAPPASTMSLVPATGQADPTASATIRYTLGADAPIIAATATVADFTISNGSVTDIACAGSACEITVEAAAEGDVTLGAAEDLAVETTDGKIHTRVHSADRTVRFDQTAPALSLAQAAGQADPTTGRALLFHLSADEDLDPGSVQSADFSVVNGSVVDVACDGAACTISVRPIRSGSVQIVPSPSFVVADAAGNSQVAVGGVDRSVEYAPATPTFTLERPADQPNPTSSQFVRFTLWADFDIDAATVTSDDFVFTGGGLVSIACQDNSCTINAGFSGPGQLTITPSGSFAVADATGREVTAAEGTERTITFDPLAP